MICINKTSLVIFVLFVASFALFMIIGKEKITGMVVLSQELQTNQTTYFDNSLLGGSVTLSFGLGDAIPRDAIIDVVIANISTAADDLGSKFASKSITNIFGSNVPPINISGITSDKDINNPDAEWEGKQRSTFNFSDTRTYMIDLKDFNLNVPNLINGSAARTYHLIFNFTWWDAAGSPARSYRIINSTKEITVRSNNFTNVNSISLTNVNGSNLFRANDYVNCSATVIDANNDEPTLSYSIWGPSKNASMPSKQGSLSTASCTGTSWDNTGKICVASSQITSSELTKSSDFGQWNCSISANDIYSVNSSNSSNIFTMSDTPVTFYGRLKNVSWYNDSEKDNEFKLETTSITGDGFYDPDSTLSYIVKGNSSINVTIGSDSYVSFVGGLKNFTGTEFVTFNASDGYSTAVSNSINLTVYPKAQCVANWSCEDWSECTDNLQFKSCMDTNSCDPDELTKTENQTCTAAQQQPQQEQPPQDNITTVTVPSQQATLGKEESNIGKTLLISFGILALICGLAVGGFFLYKYLKKGKRPLINLEVPAEKKVEEVEEIKLEERKPESLKIEPVNISELRSYIKRAMGENKPISAIKEGLVKAGWDRDVVEDELNIVSLSNYILTKLNQGMKKEAIIQSLKLSGWKEEQINEAFKSIK
ncbi:MAG: hypothetical protein AB1571_03720 [Nanoarchaeota archaeon]